MCHEEVGENERGVLVLRCLSPNCDIEWEDL